MYTLISSHGYFKTCFESYNSTIFSYRPAALRNLTSKGRKSSKQRVYQRYPKPPYSYVGMIITAIETSPDKGLTLAELNDRLMTMFEFFRGNYQGWRDSVRHTLSSSPCFIRTEARREGTSVWVTDKSKASANIFKRQDTKVAKDEEWAPTLHEQLNIPEIILPQKSPNLHFSIDNILTNIDQQGKDSSHDYRTTLSPAYDSPVFTTKSIHLRRNARQNQSSTHNQLTKLIAEQSAAWGICQEQAIENLSFLCKSMPLPESTNSLKHSLHQSIYTTPSHLSPSTQTTNSPESTYSPSVAEAYSPATSTSTHSPSTDQQPYSPLLQPYSPVTPTTMQSSPYSYFYDQNYYYDASYYTPDYNSYCYPGYLHCTDYQWYQSSTIPAPDTTSTKPLDLSANSSTSTLSLSPTQL